MIRTLCCLFDVERRFGVVLWIGVAFLSCTRTAGPRDPIRSTPRVRASGDVSSPGTSVKLSLTATVSRADDATPFWLVARFTPPAETHIYWQNPGETGLATAASFAAPSGYRVGEVRYPGPISFTSERGDVSYGYAKEVGLLSFVTPSAPPKSDATFSVSARWLSCGLVCVEERAEAKLTLPRAKGTRQSASDAALSDVLERLPREHSRLRAQWLGLDRVKLTGDEGDQLLEYFPLEPFDLDDRAPISHPSAEGSLEVEFRRRQRLEAHSGVVRGMRGDWVLYYATAFSGPPKEPSVE